MKPRSLLLACCALVISVAAAYADQPYLFDLLKQPAYRASWDAMFKGEKKVDAWIVTFGKSMDGVAAPSVPVTVGGQHDLVGSVCQPHNCGDAQLFVLFAPKGAKAWGLEVSGGKQRWFGNPGDPEKTALNKAKQQSSG